MDTSAPKTLRRVWDGCIQVTGRSAVIKFKDISFEFTLAPDKRWVCLARPCLVGGTRTPLRLPESLRQHRQPRSPFPRRLRGASRPGQTASLRRRNGRAAPREPVHLVLPRFRRPPLREEAVRSFHAGLFLGTTGHRKRSASLDLRIFERRGEAEEAAKIKEKSASETEGDSDPVDGNDEGAPPSENPETPCGKNVPSPKGTPHETPSPAKRNTALSSSAETSEED